MTKRPPLALDVGVAVGGAVKRGVVVQVEVMAGVGVLEGTIVLVDIGVAVRVAV